MKKILVIEDDVDTLDLVEYILQENGYAVIRVSREISLQEIAGINPSLILLDHLMPYALGADLCLQIKNNPTTKHIPVVIYSASTNISVLAKKSCADACIPKPFDIDILINVINGLAIAE